MLNRSKIALLLLTAIGPVACASSSDRVATGPHASAVPQGRGQYMTGPIPSPSQASDAEAPYALAGSNAGETRVRTVMRPGIRGEMTPTTITERR